MGWPSTADGDFLEDVGAFFAKVVSGWYLGPWGLIAGLVAGGIEGVLPLPQGFTGKGTGNWDDPEPDETPAAGDGKTVGPAGLTVPDVGSDVQDWNSQQGLVLNGRKYDFRVDRANQVWWSSDDGEKGFRGRRGQHVTSDFLPRRAGPKFPDYVRMFLMGLG